MAPQTAADRDLDHLYPAFRERVEAILRGMAEYAAVRMPGYRWIVVEGFRTADYQHGLYEKGRTVPPIGPRHIVTFRDGTTSRSNHQSSLAADLAPAVGDRIDWDASMEHWAYLGHMARAVGLDWGGDWTRLKDLPHVEWPESDAATYRASRTWQAQNGLA